MRHSVALEMFPYHLRFTVKAVVKVEEVKTVGIRGSQCFYYYLFQHFGV